MNIYSPPAITVLTSQFKANTNACTVEGDSESGDHHEKTVLSVLPIQRLVAWEIRAELR